MDWNTGRPPMCKPVIVLCDDHTGPYEMEAEAVPYKQKPSWMKKKQWSRPRNKWRWMKRDERGRLVVLTRKETPSAWREA
jgi:hypothetical protein